MTNQLYYGDNLFVLREHIPDASVDLIYLDPPFNSARSYNVLFKDESGRGADAQITAFEDTWHWGEPAEATYHELMQYAPGQVNEAVSSLLRIVGRSQMGAYLVMMAARLVELHRVLKPTGSLYLHCDPTASHYLKIVLDTIFGWKNFRNEIIWKRTLGRSHTNHESKRWGEQTDIILYYAMSDETALRFVYRASNKEYIDSNFVHVDENGRRYMSDNLASPSVRPNLMYSYKGYSPPAKGWAISYEKMEEWDREGRLIFPKKLGGRIRRKRYLDELPGETVQSLWDDIPPIGAQAAERLGYPTQKPQALLERIISASSNPGDIVLDPFCGCGTAIAAAQALGRGWIGIDITHLSIALLKYRLESAYSLKAGVDYQVIGEPRDVASAQQLASDNRYQFQFWALSLVRARPLGGNGGREGKKGSDRGIDGIIFFTDDARSHTKRMIVQVKSGHVKSGDIRDLKGVLEREKAEMGLFITLEKPTREMTTEAVAAGFYQSPQYADPFPRLQIVTIEQLLDGIGPKMPSHRPTFKEAPAAPSFSHVQDTELL